MSGNEAERKSRRKAEAGVEAKVGVRS